MNARNAANATPGPWEAHEIDSTDPAWDAWEIWADKDIVSSMTCGGANARLIATAPDLLEELKKEHLLALDPRIHAPEFCDVCRLVAKAEGRL
jgi:hypothetical protein